MSGTYDNNLPRDRDGYDETVHTEETRYTEGTDATAGSYTEGTDQPTYAQGGAETVRHEERMTTGTEVHDTGSVRVRKHVETHPVEYSVPRDVEHVDTSERVTASEGDSGEVEVLEDGSVSIPIFEEVLVVTKRLVVRERVIVRKHTVVDEHTLQTELRREHVTVDADDSVDLTDNRTTSEHHTTSDHRTETDHRTGTDLDGDGDRDTGLVGDADRGDQYGSGEHTDRHHRTDHEGTDRL
ncbi:MAG: hypothetical protein AVDCRST_MAG36-498 [uncultured Nocardioidaceae bacterium]|uniref:DUF2382 domain-containing protein n=1 Tax=uncultured Nocardioidaceae bacterium TaxID=253824 RepID=A0A6J4L3Y4_9ACTN|nr:MAG: hypothetical protein AVDCRST_MAG36-498 [uncultured Nocardioidaceae bacterium]